MELELVAFYYFVWWIMTRFLYSEILADSVRTRYFVPVVGEIYCVWYALVWFFSNW